MSKICPQCRTENRDLARFCMSCNTSLRADTPVRFCPSGRHPMDPGWENCPYCANEGGSARPAAAEPTQLPPLPPPPSTQRRATVIETSSALHRSGTVPEPNPFDTPVAPEAPAANGTGRRKVTVFADLKSSSPGASPKVEPGRRRIIALLVTYTWRAEGEVFPVREGRNYLGSDPDCDVRVTSDLQLSSRHATIVYRGKDFWIDDEKSMNGTFLNGETVEEKQRLPDRSIVKTGATVWHFVTINALPEA